MLIHGHCTMRIFRKRTYAPQGNSRLCTEHKHKSRSQNILPMARPNAPEKEVRGQNGRGRARGVEVDSKALLLSYRKIEICAIATMRAPVAGRGQSWRARRRSRRYGNFKCWLACVCRDCFVVWQGRVVAFCGLSCA